MAEEDLIFGKMRHLFGGIEPSNMETFTATVENGEVKITAQLPGNTIVDGQILCTVGGAIIRRKSTEYPKNEFDGDLVADITTSGTITDSTADSSATYYYAAFPYSTKGVYNRCSSKLSSGPTPRRLKVMNTSFQKNEIVNRAVINEPNPMVVFSAKSAASAIKITAELPSTAIGAMIRKSTGGYPASPEDGDEFITITSNGTYTDSDVIAGLTYYYTAFPYTSSGEYSINILNRASATAKLYNYIFGYDLDTTDNDPSTRVTYPSDVDNASYTSAYMDFTAGAFNYGSWNIAPGEKFMPKPCMLNYDGTVAYYLNPDNYAYREDGTTASDIANTSFEGNAMMEWPIIYTHREEVDGVYKFRCSDTKIDDNWECWCNYDKNNNKINHFYTPIYFGSMINGKLRSISGQTNSASTTASTEIEAATSNGEDWYIEVVSDHFLIQDLLVMMAKSTDGQTAYGQGRNDGDYNKGVTQGSMDDKGLFWGSSEVDLYGVKVFGMENLWGSMQRRTAGWIYNTSAQKIKITRGTRDGSIASDYNTDGAGYLEVDGSVPSGTMGSYISAMKTTSFGRIPTIVKGSSTTYESDGLYWTSTSGTYYAILGGYYNSGALVGPFFAKLNGSATASNGYTGAALSCKPSTK